MQLLKNKKGFTLQDLATIGVTFVVIAIVLGMGAKVLQKMTDTASGGDNPVNATLSNGTEALAELSSWLPTIAIIIAASVIIGIVVTYFYVKSR